MRPAAGRELPDAAAGGLATALDILIAIADMDHYDTTLSHDPVAIYVARYNHGVRTGDFGPLLELFAEDAEIHFRGFPIGPLSGIHAIADVFLTSPPDDELITSGVMGNGGSYRARYGWRSTPGVFSGEIIMMIDRERITALLVTRDAPTRPN